MSDESYTIPVGELEDEYTGPTFTEIIQDTINRGRMTADIVDFYVFPTKSGDFVVKKYMSVDCWINNIILLLAYRKELNNLLRETPCKNLKIVEQDSHLIVAEISDSAGNVATYYALEKYSFNAVCYWIYPKDIIRLARFIEENIHDLIRYRLNMLKKAAVVDIDTYYPVPGAEKYFLVRVKKSEDEILWGYDTCSQLLWHPDSRVIKSVFYLDKRLIGMSGKEHAALRKFAKTIDDRDPKARQTTLPI